MLEVKNTVKDDRVIVYVIGRVDSANAGQLDVEIEAADTQVKLTLDVEGLEYMSSAGLRVLLKYRKKHADLEIINASTDVYEIFDMTGFTDMMNIKRAYKKVSVDGCEVIGQGSNGKIYRIDPDTVVKVYKNPDSLADIEHERDVARKALVWGIPTAISYDVVKVGECYASMFEMLNASCLSKLIDEDPANIDKYSKMFIDTLKLIHSTEVPAGQLPDQRKVFLRWVSDLKPYLDEKVFAKFEKMANDIPFDNHMIHGDYHTNNLMIQNGEVILIDMDTLATGHPVLELASVYNAFLGFHLLDPEGVREFLGIGAAAAKTLWENTLKMYYGTEDENLLSYKEKQAKACGLIRLLRRTYRRENDPELVALLTKELTTLSEELDSLV